MARVLIVDDEAAQRQHLATVLEGLGYATLSARSGAEALSVLRDGTPIDAMVLDLVMPEQNGLAVLEAMNKEALRLPVIVQTTSGGLDSAVTAARLGAADFLVKPAAPERLGVALRNALRLQALESFVRFERHRIAGRLGINDIVATSPAMQRVLSLVRKAARSPMPVLIEGERGVGKTLIAQVLHGSSDRAGKPFVAFDCAASPAQLVDGALFGTRSGQNPALTDQVGLCEAADGGTLFLDRIGDLPTAAQGAILRLVTDGEIVPAGGRPVRVDVRVIAATDCRLLNLTKAGFFREDLFYRLNVFPIYVPPLRERGDEIAPLAAKFLARLGAESGRPPLPLSPGALQLLEDHNWPDNVAELENLLQRAVALAVGPALQPGDFPRLLLPSTGRQAALGESLEPAHHGPVHIDDAMRTRREPAAALPPRDRFLLPHGDVPQLASLERDLIVFALDRYEGHMSKVARALGIGRSTLYRKLREYGLDVGLERRAA